MDGVTDTVDYKKKDKVEASEKEEIIPDLTGNTVTLARVAEQEQDDTKSSEGSIESKDKNDVEDDDWLCHHEPGADDVHLLTS